MELSKERPRRNGLGNEIFCDQPAGFTLDGHKTYNLLSAAPSNCVA